ncbi:MAG: DUF4339 domain-containing protein [Pirellulaceae bacterium]|nr:DUF4339 domain-containing protein [Pirellulaceae bacterium]
MIHWYYRMGEADEHGPIGPSELLELIRKGVVREDTMVRKGTSSWVASSNINGLWEAAGRPTTAFNCPNCGKSIAKPPSRCSNCNQMIEHATGHLIHHKTTSLHSPKSESKSEPLSSGNNPFGKRPWLYD